MELARDSTAVMPAVLAAARATDDFGRFDGALMAVIKLQSLRPTLDRGMPADTQVALINADGRYISQTDPDAFVTPPAGTFGTTGRGEFEGPDLRTVDLSMSKSVRWDRLGDGSRVEFRIEAFNILNRANFAPPNLSVYAGAADVEPPLPNFGRIRSTVTSSRQIQLGMRVVF